MEKCINQKKVNERGTKYVWKELNQLTNDELFELMNEDDEMKSIYFNVDKWKHVDGKAFCALNKENIHHISNYLRSNEIQTILNFQSKYENKMVQIQ